MTSIEQQQIERLTQTVIDQEAEIRRLNAEVSRFRRLALTPAPKPPKPIGNKHARSLVQSELRILKGWYPESFRYASPADQLANELYEASERDLAPIPNP